MTLPDGDDCAVVCLHEVATQVFRHASYGKPANRPLQPTDCSLGKIADYRSMAIMRLVTEVQQPILD